jgi:CheY-like chemotaxis protein
MEHRLLLLGRLGRSCRTNWSGCLLLTISPSVSGVIARLLADAGFGVSVAQSAKEALALLDHRLISKRHPKIPALYMSVYSKDEILPPAALGQAPPFIRKPFTSAALGAAIQSLLGKP